MESNPLNLDRATVDDFGREWRRFDQSAVSGAELQRSFGEYFAIFPWDSLPTDAVGFDAGCGSGRWAALVAPRVGRLHCIDASADALAVAQKSLAGLGNLNFHAAALDAMPLADDSMDFGYSLGVLHHLPNPAAGLAACVPPNPVSEFTPEHHFQRVLRDSTEFPDESRILRFGIAYAPVRSSFATRRGLSASQPSSDHRLNHGTHARLQ